MINIDFKTVGANTWKFLSGLSERTLALSAIAILHVVFLPNLVAYLNGLTDRLPNLDTYLLLLLALSIMNLRAIIKNDSVSILVHSIGFISQLSVIVIVLLK